ncbi:segregation/condensation protein A [Aliifodinibius sp. S!AR15-10]|uniref:segregation and condensation protein A n=1 Tax=Aliifodinibius sp. S!AR15-10 TaxID=2950437 RepID=UPI002858D1CC|nr:segregation/condensation protein A [Aliifodinibius sp. S!AR15-10]MDR8391355.1 segregation/condensation protein A [Aliifodinibius sp. S!AR15-10]
MYRVQLKNFEGPLDLLLFFIKRDELDIYDIPISYITEEFLEYIHLMEELDLEVASEFILMASMLMSIKARMMLPQEDSDDDEMDESDPRYELVQRLLEYKRYKEAAEKMSDIEEQAQKTHYRGYFKVDDVEKQATGEAMKDVTIFDLMAAFNKVLTQAENKPTAHHVEKIGLTIEDQTEYILEKLHNRGRTSFKAICLELGSKTKVVVTFLATLEMLKEQQISLYIDEDDPTEFYLDLRPVDEIIGDSMRP